MTSHHNPQRQLIGLVGLGLMGQGIASCLLAHGFEVLAYDRTSHRGAQAIRHLEVTLRELDKRKLVAPRNFRNWKKRFRLARSLTDLDQCGFVIESIKEDLPQKRKVYQELEAIVAPHAIIASNTSSLPISVLQAGLKYPQRFIGMHWGEPAQIMRYLEIIPGRRTSRLSLQRTELLGRRCGKDPTVLKEDIRGFLSNRMMYAMLREAFHLVESGVADVKTVDQSFRNDIGWWALLAGPFRWMDLTGIPAYQLVMDGLLPKLSNSKRIPSLMRATVARGAKGISNAKGFYPYTRNSAKTWEKNWIEFTYDIRTLSDKYSKRGC